MGGSLEREELDVLLLLMHTFTWQDLQPLNTLTHPFYTLVIHILANKIDAV